MSYNLFKRNEVIRQFLSSIIELGSIAQEAPAMPDQNQTRQYLTKQFTTAKVSAVIQ